MNVATLSVRLQTSLLLNRTTVMSWIRTKLPVEILRSAIVYMRGSRIPWKSRVEINQFVYNYEFNVRTAEIS